MKGKKGQYSIMEYLFMTVFVIIIIIVLIFTIFIFQFSQIKFEEEKNLERRLSSLTTRVLNSPFFVKEEAMFDDAKLTALAIEDQGDLCKNLKEVFGFDFFIKVTDLEATKEFDPDDIDQNLLDEIDQKLKCEEANYGKSESITIGGQAMEIQCNYWEFCFKDKKFRANVLPVNIYRRIGNVLDTGILSSVDIGKLVIGVYV